MRIDAFKLKIIGIIFMVMDHVLAYIPGTPIWFGYFGRIVAPIFFYFIVEGFFYTRSRVKYATRLFGWAALMQLVSFALMKLFPGERMISNNIFLSLAFGVVLMGAIEWTKNNKTDKLKIILGIIGSVLATVGLLFTEASVYGIAMTLVFYFFRDKKNLMAFMYVVVSLLITIGLGGFRISYNALFLDDYQWMMVFAIIPILMYNGERGINNKFTKYLFYVFYPVHIWILYLINIFIFNGK
ncbi:TraX protein [Gottschalkia purinilytica]|uniref:TraX protein n=1 Tax=Gottschalkia purinilytica TaxID=1503 RepID=A0A0L0WAA8_GOTPU|nr:TraX family protein [Gottschalkia purinilytica]KNF08250.1 TraX protein [Gottschalkia purinilytica]